MKEKTVRKGKGSSDFSGTINSGYPLFNYQLYFRFESDCSSMCFNNAKRKGKHQTEHKIK